MDFAMVLSAFGAGLLSFFSPCILPLLPVYVGILTAGAAHEQAGLARRLLNTIAFVLGISLVFVVLGFGAGVVGDLFKNVYLVIALGLIITFAGLSLAGFINIPFINQDRHLDTSKISAKGVVGCFLLGLAFAFGWTPCVGPILATILALAAEAGSGAAGAGLLAVYALGMCVPFVVVTLAANFLLVHIKKLHKHLPLIQRIGGILIALMGLYMVFSQVYTLVEKDRAQQDLQQAQLEMALSSEGEAGAAGSNSADSAGSASSAQDLAAAASASAVSESAAASASAVSESAAASASAAGNAGGGLLAASAKTDVWEQISVLDLDGKVHKMSEFTGKPLYIEVWATWCPPCIASLPEMTEIYKKHAELDDVTFITIVMPGSGRELSANDFVAWAKEENLEIPVYMDTTGVLVQYLQIMALPTSTFVNSDGSINAKRVGAMDSATFETMLEQVD